jgi:hypothetical protein
MRSGLGRLAAFAEILQVGRFLALRARRVGAVVAAVAQDGKMREHLMKVFRIAAAIALLAGPAYAQGLPPINLIQDAPAKTPEQKATEEARDKAYKESLKKIPDAKPSSDPWGAVRSDATKTSAPKTTTPKSSASRTPNSKTPNPKTPDSKTPDSKTAASVKPKAKIGTDAD